MRLSIEGVRVILERLISGHNQFPKKWFWTLVHKEIEFLLR